MCMLAYATEFPILAAILPFILDRCMYIDYILSFGQIAPLNDFESGDAICLQCFIQVFYISVSLLALNC